MSKGEGKTDPGKSQISFVMTADDAERYAPPAEIDPGENLQERGCMARGKSRRKGGGPKNGLINPR